jgi:Fe2+ transport system protein B
MRKVKYWKNKLYSVVNLKENVEIVVKLVTSHFSARIVQTTMVEITETEPEQIFARTVASRAMTRRVGSNLRRMKRKMDVPVILTVTLTGETSSHKM